MKQLSVLWKKSALLGSVAAIGLALHLGFSIPAMAQVAANETLPIEIKMLHMKLSGQKPDYDKILYSNPEFQANRHKFGQEALLNQQINLLRTLYNNAGADTPIYINKHLRATNMSARGRSIIFEPIAINDPIIFHADGGEIFGVFLRNGDVLGKFIAPFEFDDFMSLEAAFLSQKGSIQVHMVIDPVAADKQPFVLDSGETVNVILADIAEIKLINDRDRKLLLHKKFNDNNGLPVPVPVVPTNRDYMPLPPATPE